MGDGGKLVMLPDRWQWQMVANGDNNRQVIIQKWQWQKGDGGRQVAVADRRWWQTGDGGR